jgi:hypothetical protein
MKQKRRAIQIATFTLISNHIFSAGPDVHDPTRFQSLNLARSHAAALGCLVSACHSIAAVKLSFDRCVTSGPNPTASVMNVHTSPHRRLSNHLPDTRCATSLFAADELPCRSSVPCRSRNFLNQLRLRPQACDSGVWCWSHDES